MTDLTKVQQSSTQRTLVFGAPKSGKSELVGKLSEKFNLIWFDCERGYTTLFKLPKAQQERINLVTVPDSRIYPIAAETWLKVIRGDAGTICEKHGKWNCMLCKKDALPATEICLRDTGNDTIVVFDSLTQFTNSCISNITKLQADDYKLEFDDWGQLAVLTDRFLSQVQAAPYNIVCITHESEVEMVNGQSKLVPTSGSSKSSRNTAKYFDHVVYCELVNGKHKFGSSTGYKASVVTGSRLDVSMEKQVVPTLLDIYTGAIISVTNEGTQVTEKIPPSVQVEQIAISTTNLEAMKAKLEAMKAARK